jgi:ornithine carbamoyltransferase
VECKKDPLRYNSSLLDKTLLMIFAKPSLRTRVSFEVAMTQLGGHAIYYDLSGSPFGAGKETIADMARTISRYVDLVMARLFAHKDLEEFARYCSVPVINGLTDSFHPCQVLADLMTIYEKKGDFKGLKLVYLGDGKNNVTHSLLFASSKLGIDMVVSSPEDLQPDPLVLQEAYNFARISRSKIMLAKDPKEAVKNADIVVTDSWMSYHVSKEEEKRRIEILKPYQVNAGLMSFAKKDAIFMHCLPAMRSQEVTSEVIDSPASVVFEEAENRLHTQKALMLWLIGRI